MMNIGMMFGSRPAGAEEWSTDDDEEAYDDGELFGLLLLLLGAVMHSILAVLIVLDDYVYLFKHCWRCLLIFLTLFVAVSIAIFQTVLNSFYSTNMCKWCLLHSRVL